VHECLKLKSSARIALVHMVLNPFRSWFSRCTWYVREQVICNCLKVINRFLFTTDWLWRCVWAYLEQINNNISKVAIEQRFFQFLGSIGSVESVGSHDIGLPAGGERYV
jgi:hypothetical protein